MNLKVSQFENGHVLVFDQWAKGMWLAHCEVPISTGSILRLQEESALG